MIKNIPTLLVVDDEKNARDGLEKALKLSFHIQTCDNAILALELLKNKDFDIVLTDIKMPKMDGIVFVKKLLAIKPKVLCFVMTAYGSVERAVEAMKSGARDFITKPFDIDDLEKRLLALLKQNIDKEEIILENNMSKLGFSIIGNSAKLKKTLYMVDRVSSSKITVLLTGESGTGKELFAKAIHQLSPRRTKPFITVECQTLNNKQENDFFSDKKNFSLMTANHYTGYFEAADQGVLFLDEIGDIDLQTQAKFLRILETKTFKQLGSNKTITVDVRLIAATNKDLKAMVVAGTFREDLYYRLNVFNIKIPPLRQRKEDIPLLTNYFLNQSEFKIEGISAEALKKLTQNSWRGNIRELKNVIERASILCQEKIIDSQHLPNFLIEEFDGNELSLNIDNNEKNLIQKAMQEANLNKSNAAKILGINRRTLYRKLSLYKLDKGD